MAGRIFAITTHHRHKREAAEEWKRLGICAIGWSPVNFCECKSLEEIKKRLRREHYHPRGAGEIWSFVKEIRGGHIILAYAGNNTIAYVGEVKGRCKFDQSNSIGKLGGKYEYHNQRRVNWWDEPHHFSRHDLPKFFAKQFGKPGRIVEEIKPGPKGFEGFIEIVRACANSGSRLPGINEDGVKAGLVKYLHSSLDRLEPGFTIKSAEVAIGKKKRDRPDFIAKDGQGRIVLIECKGTAGEAAVKQIKRYEEKFGKRKKPRLMIVAFRINEACRAAARKAGNVKLVECDLDFQKIENI